MPRYNYHMCNTQIEGETLNILCLYTGENPTLPIPEQIKCQGTLETKLKMIEIKTILGGKFGGRGIWKENALAFYMPPTFEASKVLTPEYLDNYVFA